jgi:hypothetical protein
MQASRTSRAEIEGFLPLRGSSRGVAWARAMVAFGPIALALALALQIGACSCSEATTERDRDAPETAVASEPGALDRAETGDPELPEEASGSRIGDPPDPAEAIASPEVLLITEPGQLNAYRDLSAVKELDLALSVADSHERPGQGDTAPKTEDACSGLDLEAIARRAPRLRKLRLSGCQAAVHAGLASFAATLEDLELVDLTLDGMTVARISQLSRLRALSFTRVRPGVDSFAPMTRALSLTHLTLRELERDSELGDMLGDLRSLSHVVLEGEWAGHRAMTSLAKAKRLESLTLIETSIGNFSLNQIRGLDRLHTVDWTGTMFNDNSPLHLRELPIERFRCACPRFGDGGLRHLKYLEQLTVLDLPQSQISSGGLIHLEKVPELREVEIGYREMSDESFAGLATLSKLERLTLQGCTLTDPEAQHLGELVHLRHLELGLKSFDDQAAPQLASLVELRYLDLGHTRISDDGLAALAPLTELQELKLHHTQITNRGLVHVSKLSRLRTLELDHTDLVDAGVVHLASLEGLEDLRLDSTLVTDGAIDHLMGMEKLQRLNLAHTVVTDRGAAKLRSLPSLRVVNLEDTRVSGKERP